MKSFRNSPRSPNAFHKWSDEHRAQVWDMIEKLGKGEVTHKEAREILRQEKKALSTVGRQVLGSKMYRTSAPNVRNRPRSSRLPTPALERGHPANRPAGSAGQPIFLNPGIAD